MKKNTSLPQLVSRLLLSVLLSNSFAVLWAADSPFHVKPDLFDPLEPDSLGLLTAPGTETIRVFSPADTTDKYSNGVVMTAFKDRLYCQWQSSASDEDAADTWVAFSRSEDGINWSTPDTLAPSIDNGYCSSGGWWVNGDTLVAFINVWPATVIPRGGYTFFSHSTDGITWSAMEPVRMANGDTLKGIFEQDPHALPDGRIVNAAHLQPGLIISPIYTDDPSGIRGWVKAEFTNLESTGISRAIEPSWYLRSDDTLVMIFRDQNSTYKKLASMSGDRGESWTPLELTEMPDARTKQSAGNIGDSTAFMAGNPVNNKTRIPLVVTLSREGYYFNTAFVLRKGGEGIQELRYEGQAKRLGYHYPKTMIWKDTMYVSYSTNKEDVEYTRIPVASFELDTSTYHPEPEPEMLRSSTNREAIDIVIRENNRVRISVPEYRGTGTIRIFDMNGRLLHSCRMENVITEIDMDPFSRGNCIIEVRTDKDRKAMIYPCQGPRP